MITWSKVAQFLKVGNRAEVRINLFGFLNDFKFLRTEIINDTLIITFNKVKD
jgi:hypothetical protein